VHRSLENLKQAIEKELRDERRASQRPWRSAGNAAGFAATVR
jgi:hypothetical protein